MFGKTKEELPPGSNAPEDICLLPLRDIVVFPGMIVPIFIGRLKSIATVEESMRSGRKIALFAQKDAQVNEPGRRDMFDIGVKANIVQLVRLQDGTVKLLVEATEKIRMLEFDSSGPYFAGRIEAAREELSSDGSPEVEMLMKSVISGFARYVKFNKDVMIDDLSGLERIDSPAILIDTIVMGLPSRVAKKQEILEADTIRDKLERLYAMLEGEMDFIRLDRRIRNRVKQSMDRNQREFYLNEQMRAIQKELGDDDDDFQALESKIEAAGLSKEALVRAKSELKKLKKMPAQSPEATVIRNYIDAILDLPWSAKSELNADISGAQKILDDEHYALEKVKERILEFLAVQKRVGSAKGTILCFMGPPGVGKTSLGKAISKATGRIFAKISLGGVHDEAEIRGHRRTYIGSQPGKILAAMKKAGVNNPLVMLDEIDKMGADSYHGDPASAMLEVLDPEQNSTFNDHYLDLDYDLSKVMFIATANTYDIPKPLLDRMEIIELAGYTEEEKLEIARRHIIPKELAKNGLAKDEFSITDDALKDLVRYYTRESGVRALERMIDKAMRKGLRKISADADGSDLFGPEGKRGARSRPGQVRITSKNLGEFAGIRRFERTRTEKQDAVGMVTGLAWTEVGGEILTIESAVMAGKGLAVFTGKLGDVMKESIETAKSFVRSRSNEFGIEPKIWSRVDIHVHVPEGATPKDGPSAGIAMMTSIVSTLAGIPVKKDVAMTGEITLRGRVLPIGGLKEKLLAALRSGVKTAIIPFENVKDLEEIPQIVKDGLKIIPVKTADEVLRIALARPLKPLAVKGDFFENILLEPTPAAEAPIN